MAQANAAQKEALQDELDEANQNLIAAGGDPQQRIEAMVQEHDAQVKTRAAGTPGPTIAAAGRPHGSLMQFRDWLSVRQKQQRLADAQDAASRKAQSLGERRIALANSLDNTKAGIAEFAPRATHSHEDAATLLDRQTADQRQLAAVYQRWIGAVSLQSSALLHELMLDAVIVIVVLLSSLLLDTWAQRLLDNPKLDRRQVETLRSITRMSLRVLAVLVIVLILVGVPSQFGTMIGIVGAGLTVALKDFIVAFFEAR